MARTAREEGFDEVADWFETLAKAERSHAGRFSKALNELADPAHGPFAFQDGGPGLRDRAGLVTFKKENSMREGSLEAPARHPIAWREVSFLRSGGNRQGTPAGLRYLPWLPALFQPVRFVSAAVRPDR